VIIRYRTCCWRVSRCLASSLLSTAVVSSSIRRLSLSMMQLAYMSRLFLFMMYRLDALSNNVASFQMRTTKMEQEAQKWRNVARVTCNQEIHFEVKMYPHRPIMPSLAVYKYRTDGIMANIVVKC